MKKKAFGIAIFLFVLVFISPCQSKASADLKSIFDKDYYMAHYPDVKSVYGDNEAALYNHFLTFGMVEGRSPSAEFDLSVYKQNYPDLVQAYGDDNEKYYEHYITYGKAEGRTAIGTVANNTTAKVDKNDAYLLLINSSHPVSLTYVPSLKKISGGQKMQQAVAPVVEKLLKDAKAQGAPLKVLSGYRSAQRQELLYNNRVKEYTNQGYGKSEAERLAVMTNPLPGTSEHQSGLCMDIVDAGYGKIDAGNENTVGYKWMIEHCVDYGFILRYPSGKESVTGIKYEPWHFRYVGVEAAQYIMSKGITLEEYLQ